MHKSVNLIAAIGLGLGGAFGLAGAAVTGPYRRSCGPSTALDW